MYELVWKDSRFQLVRSRQPGAGGRNPDSLTCSLSHGDMDLQAWRDYVLRGRSHDALRDVIRRSWSRCRESGVDPGQEKCWDIRDERELGEEYRLLRELSLDVQTEIYGLIRSQGLLVTVSERRGYLLAMFGDVKALRAADRLNFGPGANWSEGSVGTNAIGTALTCGHPLRVQGTEHYCESHHGWVCTAAPIFGWDGKPLAVVDISGPLDSDHSRTLELAMYGARLIESRLYRMQAAQQLFQGSEVLRTLFQSQLAGLIYVDPNGRILDANAAAAALLGVSRTRLRGGRIQRLFDMSPVAAALQGGPSGGCPQAISVRCLGHERLSATAHPVVSPNRALMGTLVVLSESKPAPWTVCRPSPTEDPFAKVLGRSRALQEALDLARRVADSDTTVLLVGESGTGKEVLARAIHEASPRKKGPFVAVNCGAIPSGLIQSVLFGYVEGAFTGARRGGSPGKFEQASGGTLFLDEIAEMPLDMQVNLLRVLEEGQLCRVGGTRAVPVDVRILAATHRDLEDRIRQGLFREDLFYRLNVVRIVLPPLRERDEDILILARHFIDTISRKLHRKIRFVSPDFYGALLAHRWPGNVRELRHAIEAAIALMPGDVLGPESLPDRVRNLPQRRPVPAHDSQEFNLKKVEAETIRRAYAHFKGNITETARALGIGRNTLYAKLKKLKMI